MSMDLLRRLDDGGRRARSASPYAAVLHHHLSSTSRARPSPGPTPADQARTLCYAPRRTSSRTPHRPRPVRFRHSPATGEPPLRQKCGHRRPHGACSNLGGRRVGGPCTPSPDPSFEPHRGEGASASRRPLGIHEPRSRRKPHLSVLRSRRRGVALYPRPVPRPRGVLRARRRAPHPHTPATPAPSASAEPSLEASPSPAAAFPVTLTDDEGAEVALAAEAAAHRLADGGHDRDPVRARRRLPRVVATTDFDDYPPRSRCPCPTWRGFTAVDVERDRRPRSRSGHRGWRLASTTRKPSPSSARLGVPVIVTYTADISTA